jgi:hypothetical protein
MDTDRYILPGILILVVLIVIVLAVALTGNNTFDQGKVSFQYPSGWSQNQVIGNFSNNSLYSEVTFTAYFTDSSGQQQPAYIVVLMQQKVQGAMNVPNVTNTTNSSVSSLTVANNLTATQLGNYGPNMVEKSTIIDQNNYYYIIDYVCPPYAINQTSQAYNLILQTFRIS